MNTLERQYGTLFSYEEGTFFEKLRKDEKEMKKVKSHFYDQIFEVFEDNSIEATKRKKYREEVGVKYVWHKRKKPERKQK